MAKRVKSLPTPIQEGSLDAETLGTFVRARRTQAGMGIHETAALCGVAVDTLTKIEKARGDVQLSSVLKVCRMLGITLKVEPWTEQ
jgi:transcriptional regulator with XRE-family HTH domain